MIENNHRYGKVILAGAGCGDPELVTLKTVKWLQKAAVILTDRLVSREILTQHANPHAEIIYVGKQCRRGFSTPQKDINDLLLQFAEEGKLVVRLKGGDVSIFSNILDELETLVKHNIPYEIVPGVSAAMGAAAYTGIPLTARNYSTAVRFLTFYKKEVVTDAYWKELATTNDTLVFYMSAETLDGVVENLLRNNISDDKQLAVIEQATTPLQRVTICTLSEFAGKYGNKTWASPTLVMIGKVVSLHQQFCWKENAVAEGEYFKPAEDVQFEELIRESLQTNAFIRKEGE